MQLSVIIVSYNVKHYLQQCLQSIWRSAQQTDLTVEVFVVDNHSHDGTIEHLQAHFEAHLHGRLPQQQLHLIANHKNVGFGRANNQALRRCKGQYVLFLNPDTLLTETTLADCWREAQAQPQLGAMGVAMLKTDGRFAYESRRGLPTPWTAFCKMSGLASLFPKSKWLGRYYMRYLDAEKAADIDIVSGAFMWCPRRELQSCGGFDETFFMYGEDIDLSYRLQLMGRRNRYLPTSILHYKGESTQTNTYKYVHVFYQAMLIFFKKHYPTSSIALTLPVTLAIYVQAALTLARNQLLNLGRFLYPNRYRQPMRIHYIGAVSTFAQIEEQSETWGVQLSCASETTPLPKCGIIAFSADDYSYQEILDFFKRSPHRSHIGIYYPAQGVLITGHEIFT